MIEMIQNGLHSISVHNGWSMALLGASIDFLGLILLFITISQIPRILAVMDKVVASFSKKETPESSQMVTNDSGLKIPEHCPEDLNDAAGVYMPLFKELGATFQLTELYKIFQKNDLPHPHMTITNFRQAGILVPQGDGNFTWNR